MAEIRSFGRTSSGEAVSEITLRNGAAEARILDWGCTLRSLTVPDRAGRPTDVVLGYDTAEEYEKNDGYLGAAIGRFANRIARGRFTLGGHEYILAVNDGANHLHGGARGFDKYVWSVESAGKDFVAFTRLSPDGEEGYPGALSVRVSYSLGAENALTIRYEAEADVDTVVNLTNHSYFNLNGGGDAMGHELTVGSDTLLGIDETSIPTCAISLDDAPNFDFRSPHTLAERISADDTQLKNGSGYDHCYMLSGAETAAELYSPQSGILMRCETDMPALQLYTANFVSPRPGKGGARYSPRQAVCLETEFAPDSPNRPEFGSPVLKKGEKYDRFTRYAFFTK